MGDGEIWKYFFRFLYIANIGLPLVLCVVSIVPVLQTPHNYYEERGQSIFIEKRKNIFRFFVGLIWAVLTLFLSLLVAPYMD